MPYAAVTDMITRYGSNELIQLTTPVGQDMVQIDQAKVNLAIGDSSALIDTYLRKRYQVPVAEVLPELNRAACIMARYDLSLGDNKEPSEQVRLARKEVIAWLEGLKDGTIVLDGAIPSGAESYAQMQDRGFTTFQDDGDPTGTNANTPWTGDAVTSPPGFWNGPLP